MPRGTIVVVGSSNIDMYILAESLPAPGETILGHDFQMKPGGKGANQAVAAARAGSRVFLVANVGNDLFGTDMVNNLTKEGVAVDYVWLDRHHPTGVAMIIVEKSGQNMIAVAAGANMALSTDQLEKASDNVKTADFLLMQLEIPVETAEHAIEMAHELRTPVVLNAAPVRGKALSPETLARVDTLLVNESEAEALTGIKVADDSDAAKAAAALKNMGVQRVVVTMGEKGALALEEESVYVPARKVEAVDTVGAGDAFCGALVTALSEGEAFVEAVKFASTAAALACTKVGAQSSLPTRVDIESLVRE